MSISQFHVEGYRSVRNVWLRLQRVNVLVGANGCGKSNLYRAMYLLHAAASGDFARSIVREGGMASILYSGERGRFEDQVRLAVKIGELSYEIVANTKPHDDDEANQIFRNDPNIAFEYIKSYSGERTSLLTKRRRTDVSLLGKTGRLSNYPCQLDSSESILSTLRDPSKHPEIAELREELLQWRFYHHFRTDANSPLRRPQIAAYTPVLSHDASDLVSALATIKCSDNSEAMLQSIQEAFPGTGIDFSEVHGRLVLELTTPGLYRTLGAMEVSDGTLQFLCLIAALLSPRPPTLLALNEPETSIHRDLYKPLAKLLSFASQHSQLWVTTHSSELADYIMENTGCIPVELAKVHGATTIAGRAVSDDDYVDINCDTVFEGH